MTTPAQQENDGRRILHGAARGAIGALAMSGLRTMTQSVGLVAETPPDAILGRKARGLLRRVPRSRRRALIQTVHCGVGASGGAMYSALPASVRLKPWAGPLFGMAIWALYEGVAAPALGTTRDHRMDARELAALAADHVLYGYVVAAMRPSRRD